MNDSAIKLYLARLSLNTSTVEPQQLVAGYLKDAFWVDVREAHEFDSKRVQGATNIPRGRLELDIGGFINSPEHPIVLFCTSGTRALLAAASLEQMGFTQTHVLRGGLDAWERLGFPLEGDEDGLSEAAFQRYARHLNLPDFGVTEQKRLSRARVMVVGCGGLGSPVIAYLSAAGVGHLRLVDGDRVDVSNLQRQIIHRTAEIGKKKVLSAKRFVEELNPEVTVEAFHRPVVEENIETLLENIDLVVDGSDNLETRYLVNRVCIARQIPYVYGAVFRDEGEFSIFGVDERSACYQCLHPVMMPRGLSPSCSTVGVLGVVPGMVGMLQANLALNYLLGSQDFGQTELTRVSFRSFQTLRLPVSRRTDCVSCGSVGSKPKASR